jgi:hypothetical protein
MTIDYRAMGSAMTRQRAALTRAINSGDSDRVVAACRAAVNAWQSAPFGGAWPDSWSRWENALRDATGGYRSTLTLRDLIDPVSSATTRTNGHETMTRRSDGTWECSARCPFVFEVDASGDDVAYHLGWHDGQRA